MNRYTAAVMFFLHLALVPQLCCAQQVVNLYSDGNPTLQGVGEKEIILPVNRQPGQKIQSIKNVHIPSIEVRLPPLPSESAGTVRAKSYRKERIWRCVEL